MQFASGVVVRLVAALLSTTSLHAASIAPWKDAAAASESGPSPASSGVVFWPEEVASGLKFPSAIVWLPDGDALVTERQGGLRILRADALLPAAVPGVPVSFQNGYNGFTDIALDPDFKTNQRIYLAISEGTMDAHHAAVYRARYAAGALSAVERIFRQKGENESPGHTATRLQFLTDKTLLLGVAEDNQHKMMAQQLSSHMGKILRLNRDGSIPQNNPFVDTPGALPEIWSYGHRVLTGLFKDPKTDEIWEVEPGPRGGDELNLLKAGGNFGWAKATWGFDYDGGLAGPAQSAPDVIDPVLIWMPAETPSGVMRYRGSVYPAWDGDFFVGLLSGKALERVRVQHGVVVLREKLLLELQERIRTATVSPDGYIYLLTDNEDGRILRLRPGAPKAAEMARIAHKPEQVWVSPEAQWEQLTPGDPIKGKQEFMGRCAGCHSAGTRVAGGKIGPDLAGIGHRKMGSEATFSYSEAMKSSPQTWNTFALSLFLANPDGYLPGTKMVAPPVRDTQVRRAIIGFLLDEPEG
ncbi:MAG: PQQ-dependent sugar dehydrogenase [Steroidobacteraceae bacterium]